MKVINSIKLFFNKLFSNKTETVVITEKHCPHCSSRGMYIFNSTSKTKIKSDCNEEKH